MHVRHRVRYENAGIQRRPVETACTRYRGRRVGIEERRGQVVRRMIGVANTRIMTISLLFLSSPSTSRVHSRPSNARAVAMRIAIHKVGKHAKLEDSSSHQTSLATTNPAVHVDVSGGRDAALLCHNLPIENSPRLLARQLTKSTGRAVYQNAFSVSRRASDDQFNECRWPRRILDFSISPVFLSTLQRKLAAHEASSSRHFYIS